MNIAALDIGLLNGHTGYSRFVILSRGRSGSNFLRGLLNSNSQIVTFGELFRFSNTIGWEFPDYEEYMNSPGLIAFSQRAPGNFVEKVVFRRFPRTILAVGFKLFYYHAREDSRERIWDYLEENRDIKIIHLVRENSLRVVLSEKIANKTNIWTNTNGASAPRLSIELDYDEITVSFRRMEEERQQADHLFGRHSVLKLRYEDLCLNYIQEMNRIQAFLGVDPENIRPLTYKQSNQPLSDAISNYSDLKERFMGEQWEHFFDE